MKIALFKSSVCLGSLLLFAPPLLFADSIPTLTARGVSPAEIDLVWTYNDSDAAGFLLERSTDGQNFSYLVTLPPDNLWYVNSSGLLPGRAYYYRIRALLPANYGLPSNIALAATEATVSSSGISAPWSNEDIGPQHGLGNAQYTNGIFTVTGWGKDVYGSADACHFVFQPIRGDGEIVARLSDLIATPNPADPWAKSGLMFRQSLDPTSPNAFLMLTAEHGAGFQARASAGAETAYTPGLGSSPLWLRLSRSGNEFTGYISADALNWTLVGSQTIVMLDPVLVGLAVTPHNESFNTSRFTDVSLRSWARIIGDPLPPSITLIGRSINGALQLRVAGAIGQKYSLEASTDLVHWIVLDSQTNTTGALLFADPGAPNYSARFYRAALLK